MAAFPVEHLAPDVAALLENLHCPVCIELTANAHIACESGHMLCVECISNVKRAGGRCPTCRQPLLAKPLVCQPINAVALALGVERAEPANNPHVAPAPAPPARWRFPVHPPRPLADLAAERHRQRANIQAWVRKYVKSVQERNGMRGVNHNERDVSKARARCQKAASTLAQKLAQYATAWDAPFDGAMPPPVFNFEYNRDGSVV
jgi:hypothetical protein